MHKPKITVDEQIAYMRDVNGIKFTIIYEDEAKAVVLYLRCISINYCFNLVRGMFSFLF